MSSFGVNYTTSNAGAYTTNSNWVGNNRPTNINPGDSVFINHAMTGLTTLNIGGYMIVNNVGSLAFTTGTGTSNLTVNTGAVLVVNGTVTLEKTGNGNNVWRNELYVNGLLQINGAVNMTGSFSGNADFKNILVTNSSGTIAIAPNGRLNLNAFFESNSQGAEIINEVMINGNVDLNGKMVITQNDKEQNTTLITVNSGGSINGTGTFEIPIANADSVNIVGAGLIGGVPASNAVEEGIVGTDNVVIPLNTVTGYRWIGGTSSDMSVASNWQGGNIVVGNGSFRVNSNAAFFPALTANTAFQNIYLEPNTTIHLNNRTLTLNGNLVCDGCLGFSGTPQSSLNIVSNIDTLFINPQADTFYNVTFKGGQVVGGLTIGGVMNIQGPVNMGNDTLVLYPESTTEYGQLIGDHAVNGKVKICIELVNTNAGWRNIGLPLDGNLTAFTGINLADISNTDNNTQINLYHWDASPNSFGNAKGNTFASKFDLNDKAYLIYGNPNYTIHKVDPIICHVGNYNFSERQYNLYDTWDSGGVGANAFGWNLVPNPYPSNLSLDHIFENNYDNIQYKAVHVWSSTANRYTAVCSTGVGVSYYNTEDSVDVDQIRPFQAFWVKADQNTTFSLNSANRTTTKTKLGVFMKNERQVLRINLIMNKGVDQAVVYAHDNGEASFFDPALDAYKFGDTKNSIFFEFENPVSIKTIGYYEDVKIKGQLTAKGKIILDKKEFSGRYVYFEQNGKYYEGTEFDANAGEFYLHIRNQPLSVQNIVVDEEVSYFEAYDMSGKFLGKFESKPSMKGFYILRTYYTNGQVESSKHYSE